MSAPRSHILATRVPAVVLLIGMGLMLLWLLEDEGPVPSPPSTPSVRAPRFESSLQCRECHRAVFDEWLGSHHQIAYRNPEVRKLSDDFRNKECQACHLPRPVFQTGLLGRALPRVARPDEGVDCLACHLAADGGILARADAPAAPCRPRASAELVSVKLCEMCHNQHQTTDQWRASAYAGSGITCNDCHMPAVNGSGRSHAFPGAHDAAMLRRAALLEVEAIGSEVALRLTNVGAGHSFPTEERHRAVDLEYRFVAAGETPGEFTRAWRFRQPYRDEPGPDTQLPADETKEVRVPVPAGATAVQARLWYRLYPYATDAESTLLFEQEVALR